MTLRWVGLLAAFLLLAGVGEAQSPPTLPSFELQRLQLEPSGLGSLVVGTGRTLAPGVVRVSLQGHYEHLPLNFLRTWDPGVNTIGLVENKFSGHVAADVMGSELRLGATVTSRGQNDTATRPEVSVLLSVPLQGGRTSAEVLIGVRKHLGRGVGLYFLGGPGVGSAIDLPTLRLLAGATFTTGEAD